MLKLFKRNFKAQKDRGKITPETTINDQLNAIQSELKEVIIEANKMANLEANNIQAELWDLATATINALQLLGCDLKKGLKSNVKYQISRKN